MSGTNLDLASLAPLRLVVSKSSAHGGSITSKTPCKECTGSDANSLETRTAGCSPKRTSSWRPSTSTSNLHMGDDPHDFYLGDIYARISRPFDCFLATQAERE
jgi:hypothetical protein